MAADAVDDDIDRIDIGQGIARGITNGARRGAGGVMEGEIVIGFRETLI